MEKIIGREQELKQLRQRLTSNKSEFIAVYGRRRVGKTFLVRAAAKDSFAFMATGQYNRPKKEQLINFAIALQRAFNTESLEIEDNWIMAFYNLSRHLESMPKGSKILFFDELPWMDTPKSGFVSALDYFWNSWAVMRDDIKLIVCGSATSWMLDNIIHETGGLHKRLTDWMLLEPWKLKGVEAYLKACGFSYSRKQIAECYMVMGGVPYYLSLLDKSLSLAQNIDNLFFARNAKLRGEFNEIFQALYRKSDNHKAVMTAIASKGKGVTREEILKMTGLENNGAFSKVLEEVEECGFIRSYQPLEKSRSFEGKRLQKATLYQVVDPYSLFYFKFLKDNKYSDEHFWSSSYSSPVHNTWAGLSFEMLCLNHTDEIKKALGISGVQSSVCSWRKQGEAQIDLLIDRRDDTINICEMKYSKSEYVFSKKEGEDLSNKIEKFIKYTSTKKSIIITLVTTFGLKNNENSSDVQAVVVLNDLLV